MREFNQSPICEKDLIKELDTNYLCVRAVAPPDYRPNSRQLKRIAREITEAAEMEIFINPQALTPENSAGSPIAAKHPLGGRVTAHDQNVFVGWRRSFATFCVYNETRTDKGVLVEATAHTCGPILMERILRYIYTETHPLAMTYGLLSVKNPNMPFVKYELSGDEHFKAIIEMLWEKPQTEQEKVLLGRRLEEELLARKSLSVEPLPRLLIARELKGLERIFGEYEGILEKITAQRIISQGKQALNSFPYFDRYNELTDTEIQATRMEDARTVIFVGGGALPITAILYARKTNALIYVIEKNGRSAQVAERVMKRCGLDDRVKILHQRAEETDYSGADVVVVAAMAEPKDKILAQASKTDFPRTIAIRAPIGDSQGFYPSFVYERLFGAVGDRLNHYPNRVIEKAEKDGVFSLLLLDAYREVSLP